MEQRWNTAGVACKILNSESSVWRRKRSFRESGVPKRNFFLVHVPCSIFQFLPFVSPGLKFSSVEQAVEPRLLFSGNDFSCASAATTSATAEERKRALLLLPSNSKLSKFETQNFMAKSSTVLTIVHCLVVLVLSD